MCFNIHKHTLYCKRINCKTFINLFIKDFECIDVEKNSYFTVGIHPKEIENTSASCLKLTDKYLSHNNVLALGEIGLDKLFPNYEKQKTVFKNLISISENHNKPVIIHCVKSSSDILFYRKIYKKNTWIIHGFRKKWKLCKQYINKNCMISLGAYIATEQNDSIIEVIKKVPLDSLFFETDESNVNIEDIYFEFAKIREISFEDLKIQIRNNVASAFGKIN